MTAQELTPEKLERVEWFFNSFNYIAFPLIGVNFVLFGIRGLIGRSPELNRAFVKKIERIFASILFIILGLLVIPVLFGEGLWSSPPARVIYLITLILALSVLNQELTGGSSRSSEHKNPELGDYHFLKISENSERLNIIINPSMVTYSYFWISSAALWGFGIMIIGISGMETIAHIMIKSDSVLEFIVGVIVSIQSGTLFSSLLGILLILLGIAGLLAGILKLFIKTNCVFDKREKLFCFYHQRYRLFRICHEIEDIRYFRIFTEKTSRRVHGEYLNKMMYANTSRPEQHYYLHVQLMSGGCPALFQIPLFDRTELEAAEERIKKFLSKE